MRIASSRDNPPPETSRGGIGAHSYQHAQALLEAGHDVEVISICKKDSTVDVNDTDTIRVHRAAWGNLLGELSAFY